MVLTHEHPNVEALLYPLMVIVAVALVVFSLLGIASVGGWMPSALQGPSESSVSLTQPAAGAFNCAECGVIESVQRVTAAEGAAR